MTRCSFVLLKRPYNGRLGLGINQRRYRLRLPCFCSPASISLFPLLGTSFIPELKEGTISPNMDRVPNISLDESIAMEMEAIRRAEISLPGVTHIVSRLGRGESPVDPAGYNESDMMIQLAPTVERKGLTQDDDRRTGSRAPHDHAWREHR